MWLQTIFQAIWLAIRGLNLRTSRCTLSTSSQALADNSTHIALVLKLLIIFTPHYNHSCDNIMSYQYLSHNKLLIHDCTMLIQLSHAAFEMLLIIISSGQTLSSTQAGGIAAGVIIAFVCIVAQFIGVIRFCYKKGVCKKSTPRPRPSQTRNNRQTPAVTTYPLTSFPTVGSNTMSHTVNATAYATTTPQFSLNGTQHPYHGQQPQHLHQPQPYVIHPDASTLTLEEPPHLKAATHAGEAPPAYHAAVHYETMTLEAYKSLKLSEGSALYSAKPDSGNTDAPPTYSEIISGQEENSVEYDQN